MLKIPDNFSGQLFMEKFNVGEGDFFDIKGFLVCPSLPNLTDEDIADCVVDMVTLNALRAEQREAQLNLKDEYQNAKSTLEQIRNAESMTQTQAIQAVQYIAKVLILLIKIVYKKFA